MIEKEYKLNGYAKMLKSLSKLDQKLEHINYMTGHVKKGVASRFKGNISIINTVKNWQGTGKDFEYYRREIDPEKLYKSNF